MSVIISQVYSDIKYAFFSQISSTFSKSKKYFGAGLTHFTAQVFCGTTTDHVPSAAGLFTVATVSAHLDLASETCPRCFLFLQKIQQINQRLWIKKSGFLVDNFFDVGFCHLFVTKFQVCPACRSKSALAVSNSSERMGTNRQESKGGIFTASKL